MGFVRGAFEKAYRAWRNRASESRLYSEIAGATYERWNPTCSSSDPMSEELIANIWRRIEKGELTPVVIDNNTYTAEPVTRDSDTQVTVTLPDPLKYKVDLSKLRLYWGGPHTRGVITGITESTTFTEIDRLNQRINQVRITL